MAASLEMRRAEHSTSGSLLQRLRNPNEQEAWNRFTELYTPLLYYWLRRLGLEETDAADLVQEVFLVLIAKMPTFEYRRDGTFRGWLHTLTVNKYREARRRKSLPLEEPFEDPPARDAAGQSEETEYRSHIVGQMLHILREEFPPSTWQQFRAYVIEGQPPHVVAARLKVSIGTVYTAKSKVLARLRQELEDLLE
jgi:RNA polymerase sigma-70 factor (ECF subfamily)